jgi:uncharacterized membrane protein (UPF0127 family)
MSRLSKGVRWRAKLDLSGVWRADREVILAHALGPEQKLVVSLTRGNVVCEDVVIADRPRRRMRGLLGRGSLPAGEGMLLQPAPSIHTAFMRFAFDAVFMDGTLRVLKVVEHLTPWRIASARHSLAVLELAEGESAARGIAVGDQLGVVEVSDELGSVPDTPGWTQWKWTSHGTETADGMQTVNGDRPAVDVPGAVDQLTGGPTKVLVVGSDRRFRSVAAALLTRRGCAVTLADRNANLADLVERERAEVVVLDAGLSLTDAAHGAARVQTMVPPVGVVIVGEESRQGLTAMPVLPRWGSFDDLYGAIERARPLLSGRVSSGGGG